MSLYAGKYVICTFLQNMRNMLRSHDRYKPVSLTVHDRQTDRQRDRQTWQLAAADCCVSVLL